MNVVVNEFVPAGTMLYVSEGRGYDVLRRDPDGTFRVIGSVVVVPPVVDVIHIDPTADTPTIVEDR
jgi:hypothetical protein